MITEPQKISLGEHVMQTSIFIKRLSDMMPNIENTVNNILEMKRQRKLRLSEPKPQEQTDCDSSLTETGLGSSEVW